MTEQMFDPTTAGTPPAPTPPAAVTPPPPAPPVAAAPPPPAVHQMTALAAGQTREQFIAAGWNDDQLIANGYMLPPGGVATAFSGA